MTSKLLVLLLLVFLFASGAFAENCYRQNIGRVATSPAQGILRVDAIAGAEEGSNDFLTNVGGYDYIFYPGTKLTFSEARISSPVRFAANGSLLWGDARHDFVALFDENTIVSTNVANNAGPRASDYAACFVDWQRAQHLTQCYYIWHTPTSQTLIPLKGNCSTLEVNNKTVKVGIGSDRNISYDLNTPGPKTLMLKVGASTPQARNPYDLNIMYLPVNNRKLDIFVGYPSIIAFSQEEVRNLSSFDTTGTEDVNLLFTLANKSLYNVTLEGYAPVCSSAATCEVEKKAGQEIYKGFHLAPEEKLIILVTAQVDKSKTPLSFVAYLDFNFSADGITYCVPGTSATRSRNCAARSSPMKVNFGLLDRQDFQIEARTAAAAEMATCVGPNGIVGQTGESVAPRINLAFGGTKEPAAANALISIDECDPKKIDESANDDWVYCSQKEFLIELAEKIGKVAQIRKTIESYESAGRIEEAHLLRKEEAPYLTFEAYIKKQNFATAPSALNNITTQFAETLGIEAYKIYETDAFVGGLSKQQKLSMVMEGIDFTVFANGVETDSLVISPGLYKISIDMNQLATSTSEDNFFDGVRLNPTLGMKVNLEKKSAPLFDWFFYETESDDFSSAFLTDKPGDNYSANVGEDRGKLINFSRVGGNTSAKDFYRTFAVPLFIRIGTGAGGPKNSFNATGFSDSLTIPNFSYWTGFASSLGNGCESIASSGEKTLPYLLPDTKDPTTANKFSFPEFASVAADQNMYLETVVYVPIGNSIGLNGNLNLYTKSSECTNGSKNPVGTNNCDLTINASLTKFSVPAGPTGLSYILNSIKDSNVCVYMAPGPTGGTVWTLFWNEQKILKELSARKATSIKDATRCAAREEILGTD